ncbi:MAG: hypothetical protein IPJ45_13365 [Ignavibacteria bacterium]|nr:hypothetical protein [Ignavibacteria bacterium]
MNYFRKLVGVTNWEDLKETIRENERLSGLMEFEKRDLKISLIKTQLNFIIMSAEKNPCAGIVN